MSDTSGESASRPWHEYADRVFEAFLENPSTEEMRDRVRGTNINEETLLATDYLNHFNEVAMIIEMVPDMPDFVEEIKAWSPKSYKAHFGESTFSDKDLAIAAYDCVPTLYFAAFEDAVSKANKAVANCVPRLEEAAATGDRDMIAIVTAEVCAEIEELMSAMRGIVNGDVGPLAQSQIDDILEDDTGGPPDLKQDSIDSLFD